MHYGMAVTQEVEQVMCDLILGFSSLDPRVSLGKILNPNLLFDVFFRV